MCSVWEIDKTDLWVDFHSLKCCYVGKILALELEKLFLNVNFAVTR
jgi:hypothetical protein